MNTRFLWAVLFSAVVVFQAKPQQGKPGQATKQGEVRILATSIQQNLDDPDDDDEEGAAVGFGEIMMIHPGRGSGATIQFRLEGEAQRLLVSARVEAVIGPDGKPVSLIGTDRQPFNPGGTVYLDLNVAGAGVQGANGFTVFLRGEEFAKSCKFLIKGKAKVAVGGTVRKQEVEVDAETGKKVKAGPFECRYLEEDNDPTENPLLEGENAIRTGIQAGVYMGVLGIFQKMTGKGNFLDSLGGFLNQGQSGGNDQLIIKGPTQYLTSVREEGANLQPISYNKGKCGFSIPRKKNGKRKITLEYWEGVEMKEIPFEFKGG